MMTTSKSSPCGSIDVRRAVYLVELTMTLVAEVKINVASLSHWVSFPCWVANAEVVSSSWQRLRSSLFGDLLQPLIHCSHENIH